MEKYLPNLKNVQIKGIMHVCVNRVGVAKVRCVGHADLQPGEGPGEVHPPLPPHTGQAQSHQPSHHSGSH
jgi:hypothetical protein